MSELHYGIVEEKYFLNGNARVAYGVAVYAGKESDDIATVIASVNDVSCDREKLIGFIRNCNEMKLSLIHLSDAVEDFLAEQRTIKK